MHIDLRLLRSFVSIYEFGSMSRAAKRDNCSQAAMSLRLKTLEDELGHRLFIRHHHRLEATLLGSKLYAKALAVLASYDDLVSVVRSREEIRKVRVGVPEEYASSFIANVLRDASLDKHGFEVEILCDRNANLLAAVQRQDIDITLVTVTSAPANALLIAEAKLMWAHHPSWRPESGAEIPLAVYPEGCKFRRAGIIAALEAAGRSWRITAESRSHAGILAAVRSGIAIAAMVDGTVPPDLTATISNANLPELDRVPIYLIKRPGESTKTMALLERIIIDNLSRVANAA
jgi:DNA-binding transcriptional LysR family regulator